MIWIRLSALGRGGGLRAIPVAAALARQRD